MPLVGISNNMAPCDVVERLPETAAAKQAAAGSKGKGGGRKDAKDSKDAKGKSAIALSKVGGWVSGVLLYSRLAPGQGRPALIR